MHLMLNLVFIVVGTKCPVSFRGCVPSLFLGHALAQPTLAKLAGDTVYHQCWALRWQSGPGPRSVRPRGRTGEVDGLAFGLAAANGRVYVSTDAGAIHCFADASMARR